MSAPTCEHPSPTLVRLEDCLKDFPPFPSVADFPRGIPQTYLSGVSGRMTQHRTFSSLGDCRETLSQLTPHWNHHSDSLQAEEMANEVRCCVAYLLQQKKPPLVFGPGFPTLPSFDLRDDVIPTLRDALLVYHRACAFRREKCGCGFCYRDWREHHLCFLFLLRFWDNDSLLKPDIFTHSWIYEDLLKPHIEEIKEPEGRDSDAWEPKSCLNCSTNCLRSFFSCLWRVNPGSLLEAIEWFGDQAVKLDNEGRYQWEEENSAWLLEDDKLPLDDNISKSYYVEVGSNLLDCAKRLADVVGGLNLNGSGLLLHAFGFLGGIGRKILIDFFGVDGRGVEIQDIGCSLASITREVGRGRFKSVPAEKARHFLKALDFIADFRSRWSSRDRFVDGSWRGVSFRRFVVTGEIEGAPKICAALDETESILRSAITALPLSPLVVARNYRMEVFYFAFLLDHENFWKALVDWVKDNCPDLAKYRRPNLSTAMFDTDYSRHPNWYGEDHRKLMEYVVSKLRAAWPRVCGVSNFHYKKAYAYWERYSSAHPDVYSDFHIKPERPDVPKTRSKEAADRKMSADMMTEIVEHAQKLKRLPFYVVVSGDADYGEALEAQQRRGGEYQFWYFKSQPVRRYLANLEERRVWLEEILELDKFSLDQR